MREWPPEVAAVLKGTREVSERHNLHGHLRVKTEGARHEIRIAIRNGDLRPECPDWAWPVVRLVEGAFRHGRPTEIRVAEEGRLHVITIVVPVVLVDEREMKRRARER